MAIPYGLATVRATSSFICGTDPLGSRIRPNEESNLAAISQC
jgi:hypothetical protein